MDVGSSGAAGIGGHATAEATAITVSGKAEATAIADGGSGGMNSSGGYASGGIAIAEATARAGGLQITVYDKETDGGVAYAFASLVAPSSMMGTIPTIPDGTISFICIDDTTPTTVTYSGVLTLDGPNGAHIKSANAAHMLSATSFLFASDIKFTVTDVADSLTIDGPTTFTSSTTFTKAGPGELLFDDDVDIADTDLLVEMESDTFSSLASQIWVDGDVEIGSVLDLDLVGAFEPDIDDNFLIIEYTGSLTGKFDSVEFPTVDGLTFGIEYNAGEVKLHVELEGDLNGDNFVGIADLNLVIGSNWNQNVDAGVLLQGDPSGDGYVGVADMNIVLDNWGTSGPPSIGAVIPEPASLALLGLGGLLLGRRR